MANTIRISIPKDDEVVMNWLKVQTHSSLSLRLLIRDFVDKHGEKDVFNVLGFDLVTGKRGRKPDLSEPDVINIKTESVISVDDVSSKGKGAGEPLQKQENKSDKNDLNETQSALSEIERMKGLMNGI